jgi:hypothetical protein
MEEENMLCRPHIVGKGMMMIKVDRNSVVIENARLPLNDYQKVCLYIEAVKISGMENREMLTNKIA